MISAAVVFGCLLQLATAADVEPAVADLEDPSFHIFQNKCISDLGCFYTGPPFYHPLHRPFSYAPADPVGTKFLLYSPLDPQDARQVEATEESVEQADFDPGLGTKVLIHGYWVTLSEGDPRFIMKDELMKEGPYNVIIVDWSAHNKFAYEKVAANTRSVGALTAKLIQLLIDIRGISPESVHLIGHSLGAHISGYIGERIPGLGRITGLDPAGPYFTHVDKVVRLDPTDADFVDVIHSNGGKKIIDLGIMENSGHLDFFPNGGEYQPGCIHFLITAEFEEHPEELFYLPCDHSRANYLFVESIKNCSYRAHQCQSYNEFTSGRCFQENSNPVVAEMGMHATKLLELKGEPKFYLKTADQPPFCREGPHEENEGEEM